MKMIRLGRRRSFGEMRAELRATIELRKDLEKMRHRLERLDRDDEIARGAYEFWCAYLRDRHTPAPPSRAEFLLLALAPSSYAEALVGDLNELFAADQARFGAKRAARLYWARAARSLAPLLLRWIGKALKWAAVISTVKRTLGW
jgi:hypothetical protein